MPKVIAKVHLTVEVPGFEPALRHDIDAELEIHHGGGQAIVMGDLPEKNSRDQSVPIRFIGLGETFLGSVLSWLERVDESVAYLPAYETNECAEEANGDRETTES